MNQEEPAELQGALLDVIQANGGIKTFANKAGMNEMRLRLILFDLEESATLLRLSKIFKALKVKLAGVSLEKK